MKITSTSTKHRLHVILRTRIHIIFHFSQKNHQHVRMFWEGSFDRWTTRDAAREHGTSREGPVDPNFGIHGGGKKDLGRSNRWGKKVVNPQGIFCFGFKAGIFWKKIGEVMIGVHLITLKWFNYGKIVCWCVFGDLGVVKTGPHPSLHLWLLPGFREEFASANWEPFKECWGRPTRYAWIWGSSKWTNCWDARRRASRTNRSSDEMQLPAAFLETAMKV